MTPAIDALQAVGIPHTIHPYDHDPARRSFGIEAAEKLGVAPERVFKTLIVAVDSAGLCVGVVPVAQQLNMKRLAKAAGGKKAGMADTRLAERTTGYVMGGMSPVGQKRPLPTYLDSSALDYATIFVSGGKRGLDIEMNPAELIELINAAIVDLT
jgi:Cys-tRNA(Pro)/Cys-tRNA(Cys) deacylase